MHRDAVFRIDGGCSLLALHIGDRILEINGAPVRGRPLRDLQRTLNTEQLIQV